MSTSTTTTIFGSFVSDLGGVLASNLPTILVVLAGLVGLGILIYYSRRWIGHK